MDLPLPRIMTWVDEGVATHVQGGERPSDQVCDPVTQLIVTSGDKAVLL